ncbi:hypothetical protein Q9L58_002439 [Maublancomyces gigas]|uniref:Uncharacterized protein n=1 Tax=Discina gigas TaxID=1032678 RepID=A0ABR3GRE0_9PEZI
MNPLPNTGYITQADDFKAVRSDNSTTPGEAETPHNAPAVDNLPRGEIKGQDRKKRMSFGGGNDGRGAPMFKNLETVRKKHIADGYDDQKPPDGFFGAAFKRFVGAKTGSAVAGGK